MISEWWIIAMLSILAAGTLSALAVWALIRKRHMQIWLPARSAQLRAAKSTGLANVHLSLNVTDHNNGIQPVDVFIAICDHYEPEWGRTPIDEALDRVRRWTKEYPEQFKEFQDSNGRVPQHTFFFPQDQYQPEYLDLLSKLCHAGFGDVDVHLHHDNDTAEGLREKMESFRETLFHRHNLLRRDPVTGEIVYGFIHGNWALCNSRPDSRWCGVDQELTVLQETGCYADFTLPSAPSPTQTTMINSIYYAQDRPGEPKSHDRGLLARIGQQAPADHLLMIQGPLTLDWQYRKWGVIPRIENGDLHGGRPASLRRLKMWLDAGVHVAGRPEWRFIKLHTHGCKAGNIDTLLGEPTKKFHQDLADLAKVNPAFRYHYVTAWEMAQLVRAAERGETDVKNVLCPPVMAPV